MKMRVICVQGRVKKSKEESEGKKRLKVKMRVQRGLQERRD